MRLAFSETMTELAGKDDRIIFLTGDLGFQLFDEFIGRFGPRYVNVGVAEAQMVLAAAGLAYEGWRPITYSIASFATARCFEQIKISVAYPHLPVLLVGAGGGFAYGSSGVTHHSAEDLGLFRMLPGMTVAAPCDADEVCQLLPQLLALPGPAYLRLGRGREAAVRSSQPALLGKARLLRDGEDFAILSTGGTTAEVVQALDLLKERGIHPLAYHFHTLKPLDTATLEAIAAKVRKVLVVEEHVPSGGLSAAVGEWMLSQSHHPPMVCLTAPDRFVLGSPHQSEIRAQYGFDAQAIVRALACEGLR